MVPEHYASNSSSRLNSRFRSQRATDRMVEVQLHGLHARADFWKSPTVVAPLGSRFALAVQRLCVLDCVASSAFRTLLSLHESESESGMASSSPSSPSPSPSLSRTPPPAPSQLPARSRPMLVLTLTGLHTDLVPPLSLSRFTRFVDSFDQSAGQDQTWSHPPKQVRFPVLFALMHPICLQSSGATAAHRHVRFSVSDRQLGAESSESVPMVSPSQADSNVEVAAIDDIEWRVKLSLLPWRISAGKHHGALDLPLSFSLDRSRYS